LHRSEQNQWFQEWFNTPYYHLLYNDRNLDEAESFIPILFKFLQPVQNAKALDLACGTGRHSIFLNSLGMNVLGIDLSKASIDHASRFENDSLHFEVHDMCDIVQRNYFDYIFNLFTSFGYFGSEEADRCVLKSCHQQLKEGGIMILDYFNLETILNILPYKGVELRGEIKFEIEKYVDNGQIYKHINFSDEGRIFHFEERVAAYTKEDLQRMFTDSGFSIEQVFGSYFLDAFTGESERVIIIAKKK
jgi:SAM-dependent methyltransferase